MIGPQNLRLPNQSDSKLKSTVTWSLADTVVSQWLPNTHLQRQKLIYFCWKTQMFFLLPLLLQAAAGGPRKVSWISLQWQIYASKTFNQCSLLYFICAYFGLEICLETNYVLTFLGWCTSHRRRRGSTGPEWVGVRSSCHAGQVSFYCCWRSIIWYFHCLDLRAVSPYWCQHTSLLACAKNLVIYQRHISTHQLAVSFLALGVTVIETHTARCVFSSGTKTYPLFSFQSQFVLNAPSLLVVS